ncbi:MAG: ABC transporter permease subunit [Candidatus Methylacidiphilales bacterium]|nr:ABC transporter permease subunit [Candidatus Methylacidiphilales bacterium]
MSHKIIRWKQLPHHWDIYLFIAPTLLLIALFQYYPAASGIFHSFYRWNGSDVSEYVGLKNYTDILKSTDFWQSFRIALILGIWNVVKLAPPLIAAVWIHRCKSERVQFIYRLLFIIPMVTPGLVVVLIWRSFFFESTQGYLNQFLMATGMLPTLVSLDAALGWGGIFQEGVRPAWLGDPRLVLPAVIIWGFPWVGSFTVLTFLAKLGTIPKEIYEAANIDGVNWWTKFTRIELPMITSSIYLMLVFVIIGTIKDAGGILILVGIEGGAGGIATVPALFMLRKAFVNQEMGAACAIGVVLTLIVLILQKFSRLVMDDGESKMNWRLKLAIPPMLMLAGVIMLCFKGWTFIGIFLILATFPYGKVGDAIGNAWARFRESLGLERFVEAPRDSQLPKPLRLGIEYGLRASKHLGVCAILTAAFLPVYLVAIVSGKTNPQYYANPGVPTTPFHWEHWSDAWTLVAPSVANSLFISIVGTIFTLGTALCAAYFFARYKAPLHSFLWNSLLILLMMPSVANLIPLFRLLSDLSLMNTLTAIILVGTASGQAFAIFVLRDFVADIPSDLFEAAEIDGASHIQQMRTIVLPLCGPILGSVGVMHFINEWGEFLLPLIVMRDAESLTVMVQLQRLAGEYIKNYGPMMAGYAIVSLPIIVLFVFSMRLFVKGLTEGAVKG